MAELRYTHPDFTLPSTGWRSVVVEPAREWLQRLVEPIAEADEVIVITDPMRHWSQAYPDVDDLVERRAALDAQLADREAALERISGQLEELLTDGVPDNAALLVFGEPDFIGLRPVLQETETRWACRGQNSVSRSYFSAAPWDSDHPTAYYERVEAGTPLYSRTDRNRGPIGQVGVRWSMFNMRLGRLLFARGTNLTADHMSELSDRLMGFIRDRLIRPSLSDDIAARSLTARDDHRAMRRAALVENLTAYYEAQREHAPNMIRQRIDSLRERQRSLEADLQSIDLAVASEARNLEAALAVQGSIEVADLHREIDSVLAHEMVEDIIAGDDGNTVLVTTETISVPNPYSDDGQMVELGRYKIHITLDPQQLADTPLNHWDEMLTRHQRRVAHRPPQRTGRHRWSAYNLDRVAVPGGWHHPHVARNGEMCTGEAGRSVNMLLDQGQLAAAVHLIIDLLQSVNVDDAYGTNIRYWIDGETRSPSA